MKLAKFLCNKQPEKVALMPKLAHQATKVWLGSLYQNLLLTKKRGIQHSIHHCLINVLPHPENHVFSILILNFTRISFMGPLENLWFLP